jgi:hypothetical protein
MASRPRTSRKRPDGDTAARVPFEALNRYVAFRMGYPAACVDRHPAEDGAFTIGVLAGWLGEPQSRVRAWKRCGSLLVYEADRIACSMKVHPFSVWGEDWLAAGREQMDADADAIEGAEQLSLAVAS